MRLLEGRKALITGGTSGLGRQVALSFATQGAEVALFGTNRERGKEVVQAIEEQRGALSERKTHFESVDVSKTDEVAEAVERLLAFWREIDILVNCAGVTRDKLFLRMEEADWDEVIDTNLKSVYNLCRACLRPMVKKRKGKIINIASVIGLTGNPGQVNYAASKLGIVGLTRALAKEVASRNICVNCIAPGFFKTPMTDRLNEAQRERLLEEIPMKRWGEPAEMADVAIFLASEMSNYITGQVIVVDGGMLA